MIAILLAGVFCVGLPARAAAVWVAAARGRPASRSEHLALVAAGLGVGCWAVWAAMSLLGNSAQVVLGAIAGVSILLRLDAARLRRSATAATARPVADSADGKRVFGPLIGAAAAMLALAVPPFVTFGMTRDGSVHTLSMTDWYKHLVVAAGLTGSESFPPANPFLSTDPEPGYYFGFHLVAAAIERLVPLAVDVYWVLLALTLLTAALFPPVVWLFARRLCGRRHAVRAALAASFLAGFDLLVVGIETVRNSWASWPLPGGLAALRTVVPSTHLDYWVHHNERQFSGAYVTTLWAPQHAAAVLLALLVLWLLAPDRDEATPPRGLLLPAVLIAALPAVSAYIALALGFGVAVYLGSETIRLRSAPWQLAAGRAWLGAGITGAILALPVVRVLAAAESPGLVLAISGAGGWSNGAIFNGLFGASWWTNLLDTPAVVLVELGIVGVLGVAEIWRRHQHGDLSEGQRQTAVVIVAVLLLVTFIRPPVGGPNNLYARPMLLVFCLLAPFAVLGAARLRRPLLVAGTAVCLLGTLFALAGNVMQGALFWASRPELVQAGEWTNRNTPRADAVAVHPEDFTRYFGFWFRRPFVVADQRHAELLGASAATYSATAEALAAAYAASMSTDAARGFDAVGARTIVVRGGDGVPAWATGPCFEIAFGNGEWLIARRLPGSCEP